MKRQKNNNYLARVTCAVLASSILIANSSFAVIEGENGRVLKKTESVYINTDSYGNVEKVNIYNYFDIDNIDEIEEFGDYESIQTITGDNKPSVSGDRLVWNVSGDKRLGYIGEASTKLASQMPWNIEIKYYLNGVETLASELPHKSGLVKVSIRVIPNKEAPKVYQNNYMMQISSKFDMTEYLSVHSDEAIEAQVGNTKSLTFMILPGHEKEVSIEIGTEDFKMDNITFAMVPLEGDMLELIQDVVDDKKAIREALDIANESLDTIFNGLSSSSKDLEKLTNENKKTQNTIKKINDDTSQRLNNIDEFKAEIKLVVGELELINQNINSIIEDAEYIKNRSNETKDVLSNINTELKDLEDKLEENEKDLERIEKRSKELDDDLGTLKDLIIDLKSAVAGLGKLLGNIDLGESVDIKALSTALYAIKGATESIAKEAGAKLQSGGSDPEFYMDTISTAQNIGKNLQTISEQLSDAQDLMEDTNKNTSKLAKSLDSLQMDLIDISEIVDGLQDYSKDVPITIKNLDLTIKSINSLINDITSDIDDNLSQDNKKLNKQIDNLTSILKEMQTLEKDIEIVESTMQNTLSLVEKDINTISNDAYGNINGTIDGLNSLMKNLKIVTGQSNSLKNSKNQIYDIITSDVDDLENKTTVFEMDPDMPTISFASSKNESPKKVQIFVQTDSIKEKQVTKTVDLEPTNDKLSFVDKIKVVFNKILEFFKNLFKRS